MIVANMLEKKVHYAPKRGAVNETKFYSTFIISIGFNIYNKHGTTTDERFTF
jgi:hypothetical protein